MSNILNKVFSSANDSANKTENVSKTFNESSDVYRSPSSYSLYNDMMKKHDEISKNIPNSNKTWALIGLILYALNKVASSLSSFFNSWIFAFKRLTLLLIVGWTGVRPYG